MPTKSGKSVKFKFPIFSELRLRIVPDYRKILQKIHQAKNPDCSKRQQKEFK